MRIRSLGELFVRLCGRSITDYKTGEGLGKAVLLTLAGRVYVLGYDGSKPLIPVFLPQPKLQYWKVVIGFTVRDEPDFDNVK